MPTFAEIAFISSASLTIAPSKPSSLRKRPDDRLAQRRRDGVECRHEDVRRHDRGDSHIDGGPKRPKRTGYESVSVVIDHRQLEMRVDGGVTVPRKVLRARRDAAFLGSGYERRYVARNELGLRAERANPDDRVPRIRVHVGHRSEIQCHARRAELTGDRSGDRPSQLQVVDEPQCQVAWIRATRGRLEPRHVPALLVDRDDEVRMLAAEHSSHLGDLLAVTDVIAEKHDSTEAAGEPAPDPIRRLVPGKAREQAPGGPALDLSAHPRTAPAVRPKAMRR